MLNTNEHEISKTKMLKNIIFLLFNSQVFYLFCFKMPTIIGILTFMSWINFMLCRVEHDKSFKTSMLGLVRPFSYKSKVANKVLEH